MEVDLVSSGFVEAHFDNCTTKTVFFKPILTHIREREGIVVIETLVF